VKEDNADMSEVQKRICGGYQSMQGLWSGARGG
jgi:hypothetical protein